MINKTTNQKTITLKTKTDMETTIKGKEVIAYKCIESSIACSGQYEIGKTYKAELCKCRFHACLNPRGVLSFFSEERKSRYYKVKLSGEITECNGYDKELAATEMTILEEISSKDLSKITEWWKSENVIDLLYFSDGLAKVQRGDGKYNFIDKNGKLLSSEWFRWAGDFFEGFARVERTNGEQCKIDKTGKIVVSK